MAKPDHEPSYDGKVKIPKLLKSQENRFGNHTRPNKPKVTAIGSSCAMAFIRKSGNLQLASFVNTPSARTD